MLYFTLDHPEDHVIHTTDITIKTETEQRKGHQLRREENGVYSLSFQPFNEWPDELQTELHGLTLIGDDTLSFSFDATKYDEYTFHKSRGARYGAKS